MGISAALNACFPSFISLYASSAACDFLPGPQEKACRLDCGYDEETCYNLTHDDTVDVDDDIVEDVQKRVSEIELWDGVLFALPAIIFVLFVGTW